MTFMHGEELKRVIREAMTRRPLDCAVAYWGVGSEPPLLQAPNSVRLVCSLTSGGTNPAAISALLGREGIKVRQLDSLHAKVYITLDRAIVTSANASENGLGFEGTPGLYEAGVVIEQTEQLGAVKEWFEALWGNARSIGQLDLDLAQAVWNRRPKGRQTPALSFSEFARRSDSALDEIFLNWYHGHSVFDVAESAVQSLSQLPRDVAIERIQAAFDREGPEDDQALTAGRWVVEWQRTNAGRVSRRQGLSWARVESGTVVRRAGSYRDGGGETDVILAEPTLGVVPFDLKESRFVEAFCSVIESAEFAALRTADYDGAWFTPMRIAWMRRAWRRIRRQYGRAKR